MVLIQEKANLEKHKFTPIAGKRGPVDAALLVNADQKYAFTLAMEIQEVLPHKTHNAREYSRVFDPKRYLGLIFDDFSIVLSSLIESYV